MSGTQTFRQEVNCWLLTTVVVCVSLQLLVLLGVIAAHFPTVYTAEVADFYLRGRPNFPQEYDLPVYRLFVLANAVLAAAVCIVFKKRLASLELTRDLFAFVLATMTWVALAFFSIFKIALYKAHWAEALLWAAIIGNALTWIAWPWRGRRQKSGGWICARILDIPRRISWLDAIMILAIGAVVIANPQSINQALLPHHIQLQPSWLWAMMMGTWVYMGMVYVVLRLSLRWFWLAVAGILLVLKWHMFHWGAAPLLWLHPLLTVWPTGTGPDLPYFWPLHYRAFGAFTFSFIVPMVYVAALMQAMNEFMQGSAGKRLWARGCLSCLGLVFFIQYLRYPVVSGYLAHAWPLVVLLGMWLDDGLSVMPAWARRAVLAALVAMALVALLTNQLWLEYMNFKKW